MDRDRDYAGDGECKEQGGGCLASEALQGAWGCPHWLPITPLGPALLSPAVSTIRLCPQSHAAPDPHSDPQKAEFHVPFTQTKTLNPRVGRGLESG